jgi:universal stress protein A
MPRYKKILVSVDLYNAGEQVAVAGRDLAANFGASVVMLHVVEHLPVEPLPLSGSLQPRARIERDLLERSRDKLTQLVTRMGLDQGAARVETGNTKAEILRVAREESADLIVLGSRERRGAGILLNLTEDTVLHAARCDVLAIRLK